jgi:site-specific recombinase XerD
METRTVSILEMSLVPGIADPGHTWLTQFVAFAEAQGCAASSIRAYRQDLKHFVEWFERINGQPFEPGLITGVDLRAYRTAALDSGISAATWNRKRATLRKLCDFALQMSHVTYDPFQGVEVKPQEEQPPRWLTEAEYHRLARQIEQNVNAASTDHWRWQAVRDQAIVALMLYAGLREAEVCDLDVGDVQIGERKGRLIVRNGKGGKERQLPLNNEARRALKLWIAVAGIADPGLPLFIGKGGERIGVRLVQKRVAALRQACQLDEDVTPHALRHTFAKRLLDSGAPLTVVSKLLGHSRIETTKRYVQPGWEDFEKAVEKL